MKFIKWLLFPFALLYGGIMAIRNFFYRRGIFESTRFSLPVISVGNLTVGGTGKTPHVEFLLRLLKPYQTATLSRGYKRQTKGFVLADKSATALTIGDEPFQYFLDFPGTVVAVCEKRVEGIRKIQDLKPETDVIILDDAFQHQAVTPAFNLLLTDFYRRFDTDFMLPTGLLREPRSGAKRADAVIVTKCPVTLSEAEKQIIKTQVKRYTQPGTSVFFTTYTYAESIGFGSRKETGLTKKVILVTAIANPEPLINYLKIAGYQVMHHFNFPDHHAFSGADLKEIARYYEEIKGEQPLILTTRKDSVKLLAPEFAGTVKNLPFFYVPITVAFLADQPEFESLVLQAMQARVS